jgi:hypothetical protein
MARHVVSAIFRDIGLSKGGLVGLEAIVANDGREWKLQPIEVTNDPELAPLFEQLKAILIQRAQQETAAVAQDWQ